MIRYCLNPWFTLTLCFVILVSCDTNVSQNLPIQKERRLENGQILVKWSEINGKKQGPYYEYDIEGNLRTVRNFINDFENGRTVFFHENGEIAEVVHFLNGVKHGGDTMFLPNGLPGFVLGYREGKKHGYLRKWTEDGTLLYEARYDMDTLVEVKGQPVR